MDEPLLVQAICQGGADMIERLGYLAHAQSQTYQNKVAKALELIVTHDDYAVSVSWGKDSIVLLHLCATVYPDITALHGRYGNINEHIADTDRVRDAMLAKLPNVVYDEIPIAGEWDMFERAGGAFDIPATDRQKEAYKWWVDNKWSAKSAPALVERGKNGSFVGMRQEESHARRMTIAKRGKDYQKANGDNMCLPLAHWTGKDIWAYIFSHDLPYLTAYDNANTSRERVRSEFVFSGQSAEALKRHGVWQDWERCYPDEFSAWMAKFPELMRL